MLVECSEVVIRHENNRTASVASAQRCDDRFEIVATDSGHTGEVGQLKDFRGSSVALADENRFAVALAEHVKPDRVEVAFV